MLSNEESEKINKNFKAATGWIRLGYKPRKRLSDELILESGLSHEDIEKVYKKFEENRIWLCEELKKIETQQKKLPITIPQKQEWLLKFEKKLGLDKKSLDNFLLFLSDNNIKELQDMLKAANEFEKHFKVNLRRILKGDIMD